MPATYAASAGTLPQWRHRARRRCGRVGLVALVASAIAAVGKSSVAAFASGNTLAVPRRRPFQVRLGPRAAQPGLAAEAETSVAQEVEDAGVNTHLLGGEGASAESAEEGGADKAATGSTNIALVRSTNATPVSVTVETEVAPLYEKVQRIGQRVKAFVEYISVENGTAQLHIGEERLAELNIADLDDDDYLEPCQIREVYVKDFDEDGNAIISTKPVRTNRIESSLLRPGARLAGKVKGFNVFGDVFVDIGADRHAWLPVDRRYWDDNLTEGQTLRKVYVRKHTEEGIQLDVSWPKDVLRPVAKLRVGDKLKGVVAAYNNRTGTAFLDVGAVRRGMLLRKDRINGSLNSLKMGAELVVYVKDKLPDDSGFALTMHTPKLALEQLLPGQKYEGSFEKFSNGGAFIDIGAARNGWLPANELDGPHADLVGQGKNMTVWVAEVREEKDFLLTLEKPKFGYREVPLGSNLTGVVVVVTDSGIFVDVGWVSDGFVNPQLIPASLQPRVGDKVEVWVSAWRDRARLQLTMIKPRVRPEDLMPSQQIKGKVVDVQRDGTAFVDYGSTADAILPADRIGDEVLEVGDEVDAHVFKVKRDGRVFLSLQGARREAFPE